MKVPISPCSQRYNIVFLFKCENVISLSPCFALMTIAVKYTLCPIEIFSFVNFFFHLSIYLFLLFSDQFGYCGMIIISLLYMWQIFCSLMYVNMIFLLLLLHAHAHTETVVLRTHVLFLCNF